MSKAFIKALSGAIQKATTVQELLLRQRSSEDNTECLDLLDSIVNTLHGLREEERESARFDAQFLDSPFEALEELEREEDGEVS